MAAARLAAFTADEKTAIAVALKRVIDAAAVDPEHPSARRISALQRIIARLEAPDPPVELDELILLFEAVLAASRRPPLALH
jgi:hypothetical protein